MRVRHQRPPSAAPGAFRCTSTREAPTSLAMRYIWSLSFKNTRPVGLINPGAARLMSAPSIGVVHRTTIANAGRDPAGREEELDSEASAQPGPDGRREANMQEVSVHNDGNGESIRRSELYPTERMAKRSLHLDAARGW